MVNVCIDCGGIFSYHKEIQRCLQCAAARVRERKRSDARKLEEMVEQVEMCRKKKSLNEASKRYYRKKKARAKEETK